MKKKLLFVINTLGRAGAETALLELLRQLAPEQYDVSLFVLTGQGELAPEQPPYVRLLNRNYDHTSVLSRGGKRRLMKKVLRSSWARGTAIRLLPLSGPQSAKYAPARAGQRREAALAGVV